jgi:hypothetical protein
MNKEFTPYDIALELKQLGFDEPCFGWYVSKDYGVEIGMVIKSDLIKEAILAPTFSQSFRFFREKYGLFAEIKPYLIVGTDWWYKISDRNNSSGLPYEVEFKTYEEAELVCLRKLIEIVKTK